jgi:hypothetical protein
MDLAAISLALAGVAAFAALLAVLPSFSAWRTKRFRARRAKGGTVLKVQREMRGRSEFALALGSPFVAKDALAANQAEANSYWYLREAYNGRDYGMSEDDLVFSNLVDQPIVIESISAVSVNRLARWGSTLICRPTAGSDFRTALGFDFSRKGEAPCVEVVVDGGASFAQTSYFSRRVIALAPLGQEHVTVYARPDGGVVTWRLDIRYRIEGVQRTLIFPDVQNEPLCVVGVSRSEFRENWMGGVGNPDGSGSFGLVELPPE